jgi:hypothetical protein
MFFFTIVRGIEKPPARRTEATSISDYYLPLRWRYTIAITTPQSTAIITIPSNPGDFVAGAGGGVVGWSFASPGKVRLFISCRFE